MATHSNIRYRTTETTGALARALFMAWPAPSAAQFADSIVKVNAGSTNALAGGCVR